MALVCGVMTYGYDMCYDMVMIYGDDMQFIIYWCALMIRGSDVW